MFTVNLTGHCGISVVELPSDFCICLSVKNKQHKSLHCSGFLQFMNQNYIHKITARVYVLLLKQRMKPNIMGWPIFFCFLARVLCMK